MSIEYDCLDLVDPFFATPWHRHLIMEGNQSKYAYPSPLLLFFFIANPAFVPRDEVLPNPRRPRPLRGHFRLGGVHPGGCRVIKRPQSSQ
jgi:hypothetical protein